MQRKPDLNCSVGSLSIKSISVKSVNIKSVSADSEAAMNSVEQAFRVDPDIGTEEGAANEVHKSSVINGSTKRPAGAYTHEYTAPNHSYCF